MKVMAKLEYIQVGRCDSLVCPMTATLLHGWRLAFLQAFITVVEEAIQNV